VSRCSVVFPAGRLRRAWSSAPQAGADQPVVLEGESDPVPGPERQSRGERVAGSRGVDAKRRPSRGGETANLRTACSDSWGREGGGSRSSSEQNLVPGFAGRYAPSVSLALRRAFRRASNAPALLAAARVHGGVRRRRRPERRNPGRPLWWNCAARACARFPLRRSARRRVPCSPLP
jgi:hypothetical protein